MQNSNAAAYFGLAMKAEVLTTTPRWTDGPRSEEEVDAAGVRSARTSRPSPIDDDLMQIILDIDELGAGIVRGGLPRWALRQLSGSALTVLLQLREERVDPAISRRLAHLRPADARRVLRAYAMPEVGAAGDALRDLLKALGRRLSAYEGRIRPKALAEFLASRSAPYTFGRTTTGDHTSTLAHERTLTETASA